MASNAKMCIKCEMSIKCKLTSNAKMWLPLPPLGLTRNNYLFVKTNSNIEFQKFRFRTILFHTS